MPKEIKETLYAEIDVTLIKQRQIGNKEFDYITGAAVIDILNKAFNCMWCWVTDREWIQPSEPFYNKNKNQTEVQGPVAHVHGTLTIFFMDDNGQIQTLTRDAYGSKSIIGRQAEQESIFKSASTDALKKAASTFGIALSLYRDEYEQEVFRDLNNDIDTNKRVIQVNEEIKIEDIEENADVWTDRNMQLYQKDVEYVSSYLENLDDDEVTRIIKEFNPEFNDLSDIRPSNVVEFREYLEGLKNVE